MNILNPGIFDLAQLTHFLRADTAMGAPWVNGLTSIVDGLNGALLSVWGSAGGGGITTGLLSVLGVCLAIKITMTWIESMLSGDSAGMFGQSIHALVVAIIMATAITNMPKISNFTWSSAGGMMAAFNPYSSGGSSSSSGGAGMVGGALDSIFASVKNNASQLWDLAVSGQSDTIAGEEFSSSGRQADPNVPAEPNSPKCWTDAKWSQQNCQGMAELGMSCDRPSATRPSAWQRCEGEDGLTLVTYLKTDDELNNRSTQCEPGLSWDGVKCLIGAPVSLITNLSDNLTAALLLVIAFLLMLLFVALVLFQLIAGVFRIVAGLLFMPVGFAFWPIIDDWGKKAISIVMSGLIQMGIISFMMGVLGKIVEGMILSYGSGKMNTVVFGLEMNGGKTTASVLLIGMVFVMAIGAQVAISASTGIFSGLSFAVRGVSTGGGGGGGGGIASSGAKGGGASAGGGAAGGGAKVGSAAAGAGGGGAAGGAATAGASVATAGAAVVAAGAVKAASYMNKQINRG